MYEFQYVIYENVIDFTIDYDKDKENTALIYE